MARGSEIVIIGGGIVGLSIAYHLAARGRPDVCVLERGQIGQGATAKATGGIRQQFTSEINIRLSQESLKRFERFEEEMGCPADFRQVGYLFLASSEGDWSLACGPATSLAPPSAELMASPTLTPWSRPSPERSGDWASGSSKTIRSAGSTWKLGRSEESD